MKLYVQIDAFPPLPFWSNAFAFLFSQCRNMNIQTLTEAMMEAKKCNKNLHFCVEVDKQKLSAMEIVCWKKRQRKMFSLGIVWYSIVEQKSRVNVSKRLRRQRRRSIQRAYTLRVSVRSVGAQTVRPLLHTAQHGVVAVYSRSIEASKQSESE